MDPLEARKSHEIRICQTQFYWVCSCAEKMLQHWSCPKQIFQENYICGITENELINPKGPETTMKYGKTFKGDHTTLNTSCSKFRGVLIPLLTGSRPTAAVLCPWARHFTPRKYWLITQEAMAPSRHDWKIVDWDVKPQHNQPTFAHYHFILLTQYHLLNINLYRSEGQL